MNKEQILEEFAFIDRDSIRPLRAIVCGTSTEDDISKLKELNDRAIELRLELS